ncbi:hypothetical protein AZE42_09474, partial [Rhizopogon vesiculosus]
MLLEFIGPSYFMTTIRGNIRWVAAELFEVPEDQDEDEISVSLSTECDIYSFGSITLQVLTCKVPYYNRCWLPRASRPSVGEDFFRKDTKPNAALCKKLAAEALTTTVIKRRNCASAPAKISSGRVLDQGAAKAVVSVYRLSSQHPNTEESNGGAEEPQPRRKRARRRGSDREKGRLRQKDDDEDMRVPKEKQELLRWRNEQVTRKASRDSHGSAGEGMSIQQVHSLPRRLPGSGFAHTHHLAHIGWGDGAFMAAPHAELELPLNAALVERFGGSHNEFSHMLYGTDDSHSSFHDSVPHSLNRFSFGPSIGATSGVNEGLSAAAAAASAAMAEGYHMSSAAANFPSDDALDFNHFLGLQYGNLDSGVSLTQGPYTVDPTQILPVEHGGDGVLQSYHTSPSIDEWGNGITSSSTASPEPYLTSSSHGPLGLGARHFSTAPSSYMRSGFNAPSSTYLPLNPGLTAPGTGYVLPPITELYVPFGHSPPPHDAMNGILTSGVSTA